MASSNDKRHRTILPIADIPPVGLTSYGSADLDARFRTIEPARPLAIGLVDPLTSSAKDRFSPTLEVLPTGVLVISADGRIVLVNRELERQFGYPRRELLGRPVEILVPGGLPEARDLDRQVSGSRAVARAPGLGLRRDGSRFAFELGLNPVDTSHGVLVFATVVDVSRYRESEQAASRKIESQIEFERLVAEISVQFISLPLDQIDEAIRAALRRVATALDVDRCHFCRVRADGMVSAQLTWEQPGIPVLQGPVPSADRFPWLFEKGLAGELVCFSKLDEVPNDADRATFRDMGTKSAATVPLRAAGKIVGVIGFNMVRHERSWEPQIVDRMRQVATAFGSVLARRETEEALRQALDDLARLRAGLHDENVYLRQKINVESGDGSIIGGQSPAIRRVLEQIRQVASTDSTVLLLGETGTGKELLATHLHQLSARRGRDMVRVNCSAIPATLIESELFGREKGAFTGALSKQIGRFELADHSTIFLDEIGDLPLEVQVKLLRVLEERHIERLGSPRTIRVDTRVIAATHRNLEQRIADGTFREDLFYRLNVFPIFVPPLRERVEDIPILVWRFVNELSKAFGKRIDAIPRDTMDALQRYSWPGNIRELRNLVERAMIVATGPKLTITLPPSPTTAGRSERLADVERQHIRHVLESVVWRIRGTAGAADRLGMKPTTLETRMAKLGLKRPKH